jgi:hypothetical protein
VFGVAIRITQSKGYAELLFLIAEKYTIKVGLVVFFFATDYARGIR